MNSDFPEKCFDDVPTNRSKKNLDSSESSLPLEPSFSPDSSTRPSKINSEMGRTRRVMFLFEGGLFLLALGIGFFFRFNPFPISGLSADRVGRFLLFGILGTIPALLFYFLLERIPLKGLRQLNRLTEEFVREFFRKGWKDFVVSFFLTVVTGFGEETLFRGLIQSGLAHFIGGESGILIGLIVASLLFGFAHALTWTYAILAAMIGFYLGGILLLTGNLLVPITVHALYDFAVIQIILSRSPQIPTFSGISADSFPDSSFGLKKLREKENLESK